MNKSALALSLALLSGSAIASDYSLVIHGFSKHSSEYSSKTGKQWDETNYGLGLRYKASEDIAYQGGFYQNSEGHTSLYGGIDWLPLHVGRFSAGASLGLVTGYETFPIVPAVTLVGRVDYERFGVAVRWLPPVTPKLTAVIAIEATIRF